MDERSADTPLGRARQHRDEIRSAMSGLERALVAPSSAGVEEWAATVRARLDGLGGALGRHIANSEGEGGLFTEVIEHAPRLAHRVDSLRQDHTALTAEVAALAARLQAPLDAEAVAAVRRAGIDLLAHVAHHRYLGSDLVYEAYTVDIDAAD